MTRMVGGEFLDLRRLTYGDTQAGEAVNQFQVVYMDGAFVRLADPSDSNAMPAAGMALASGGSGGIFVMLKAGIVSAALFSGNIASGQSVFLGSGSRVIASAPNASGQWAQRLGEARTETVIDFFPESRPVRIAE